MASAFQVFWGEVIDELYGNSTQIQQYVKRIIDFD